MDWRTFLFSRQVLGLIPRQRNTNLTARLTETTLAANRRDDDNYHADEKTNEGLRGSLFIR